MGTSRAIRLDAMEATTQDRDTLIPDLDLAKLARRAAAEPDDEFGRTQEVPRRVLAQLCKKSHRSQTELPEMNLVADVPASAEPVAAPEVLELDPDELSALPEPPPVPASVAPSVPPPGAAAASAKRSFWSAFFFTAVCTATLGIGGILALHL